MYCMNHGSFKGNVGAHLDSTGRRPSSSFGYLIVNAAVRTGGGVETDDHSSEQECEPSRGVVGDTPRPRERHIWRTTYPPASIFCSENGAASSPPSRCAAPEGASESEPLRFVSSSSSPTVQHAPSAAASGSAPASLPGGSAASRSSSARFALSGVSPEPPKVPRSRALSFVGDDGIDRRTDSGLPRQKPGIAPVRAVSGARLFQLDDGGLRALPMSLDRTSHGIFFWKKEVASPCDQNSVYPQLQATN